MTKLFNKSTVSLLLTCGALICTSGLLLAQSEPTIDDSNVSEPTATPAVPDPNTPQSSLIRRAPNTPRQSNASDLIDQSPARTQRTANDFNLEGGNLLILSQGIPLIDPDNEYSLQISLLVDGEVHVLRNSRQFLYKPIVDDESPINIWKSNEMIVQVVFSYPQPQLFQMTLILNNVSNRELDVGARLLFDTALVEDYDGWFESNTARFDGESELIPDKNSRYISSTPGDAFDSVPELVFVLQGENISIPSKVVLANWERLNEFAWYYRAIENRSFTKPPYRSADSGVALYYNPQSVAAGKRIAHQVLLSTDRDIEFIGFPVGIVLSRLQGIDIAYLWQLLEEIEEGIEIIEAAEQNNSELSDDNIDQLEGSLNNARERLR